MHCWIALHTTITTEAALPVWNDTSTQQTVASIALGFTPRVALVDEAVLMDVTGSLRLFGGLVQLMKLLTQRVTLFFESMDAVSLMHGAHGTTSLIALGRLRLNSLESQAAGPVPMLKKRVADFPMHTLTAAREHLSVLERIGCRTWDDLLRLPRDGVARRFGAGLLHALDRACGRMPDHYEWQALPQHFEERLELDALVIHGPALMGGVERLLVKLQAWLLGRQSGISALKLVWHLDKRRDVALNGELEIRTAQPAQDLRHVARLIAEHLAQQKLPAPVHSLSLLSLSTERLIDSAAATGSLLLEARQKGDNIVELIERLSARLGETQVQAWQPAADHRPEQMQRWVSAKDSAKSSLNTVRLKNEMLAATLNFEALYPSWLLHQPFRLQSLGNSPVYQGKLVRLTGPQRLETSGWLMTGEGKNDTDANRLCPPALRDYFIYRSEQGGLLWIYSERLTTTEPQATSRHAWYLHGFFA